MTFSIGRTERPVIRRTLLILAVAAISTVTAPGCGSSASRPVVAQTDTATKSGVVCDTTLDTSAASSAAIAPDTRKSAPAGNAEPAPVTPRRVEKAIEKSQELPKMWDFGSTTCIPCKTMKQILDPMTVDYKGKIDIRIINIYDETELARKFRIVTIPTQVFIDVQGKELLRHVGVYPRDSIEARFREFGMPVVAGTTPTGN